MASKINPLKTDEETLNNKEIKENHLQDMQNAVKNFFNILMSDNEKFNAKRAFDVLYNYILTYDRILYSTVSNIIYECNEEGKNKNLFGTILSNVEELVAYTEDSIIMASLIDVAESEEHKRAVYDTQKAVWKIWDHINLAHHQYLVFWQSEDQYDKRFEARIQKFQGKITNEMSSQLLAMIGIFTALAFLIFGSISSLESIFAGISNTPVLKLMLAGCVWGLGLADFGILILIDSCCKLNEGTLSMCNDLADLGNNIVSVIALYTASIPVIYNSYDYNNNIENYDEYFRYKRKKYRTDATFSNINGFILEIGICILAFIVALKGYNFFQKYRRKRSALREFLNKDNMKTVLVIMAAGISSRFGGGIKQLAPVGLNGEIIMDYSIHDAIEAGFNKIVFIIRKDIKDAFKEAIGDRIEKI